MATTLGQAFDLAYKKYLEAKRTTPAKEQVKALKNKVRGESLPLTKKRKSY